MGRGGPSSLGPPSRDNTDSASDCPTSQGERPGTGLFEAAKPTFLSGPCGAGDGENLQCRRGSGWRELALI